MYIRYLFIIIFISNNLIAQMPTLSYGKIERIQSFASEHIEPRNVDIWLPDDYSEAKKYAVLYMHDGQMLFDSSLTWNAQEWQVDETMAQLLNEGKIRNTIVVAIWNTAQRHSEYFPQKAYDKLNKEQLQLIKDFANKSGRPLFEKDVNSDAYLRFIVKELKPYIDEKYSIASDLQNTFIAGSSMGGLISLYALCEYPDVFGGAACISTHWPGIFNFDDNPVPQIFYDYLRKNLPVAGKHRLYFDHGTINLDAQYPALQAEVDKIQKQKKYGTADWKTLSFEGADHNEKSWAKRLNMPFHFLLNANQ
jgi:predicted alpha/beta superfamily hydrolase